MLEGFIVRPTLLGFIGIYIKKRTLPGEVKYATAGTNNCLESEFASGIIEPTSFAGIFKISTNHKTQFLRIGILMSCRRVL